MSKMATHAAYSLKKKEMLKGLRREDFAILGQFCAKVIAKCLYSYATAPVKL